MRGIEFQYRWSDFIVKCHNDISNILLREEVNNNVCIPEKSQWNFIEE